MTRYQFVMQWPLPDDARMPTALDAARLDIGKYAADHHLIETGGQYTILHADQCPGATCRQLIYVGTMTTAAELTPPLVMPGLMPVADEILDAFAQADRHGAMLVLTRDGWSIDFPTADPFDGAPLADDDQPLAPVHHLPVSRTA